MEKILQYSLRIIGFLSVIVITFWIWLYFIAPKPYTISTNFVSSLSIYDDPNTPLEDATVIVNLKMLKNKKITEGSQKLFEMAMTTYQGLDTTNKFTKGVQILGDLQTEDFRSYKTVRNKKLGGLWTNYYLWDDIKINNLYSYDISYDKGNGTAYASPTALNNNSEFVVSAGKGENATLALLKFKKEFPDKKHRKGEWFGVWDNWLSNWDEYPLIGFNYMVASLYKTVNSLEAGTYYLTLDLSEFFTIELLDNNNQFTKQTTDKQFTYVTCKIDVEDEGLTTKSQSMFKMIAQNDGSVKFDVDTENSLFWKALENVTITVDSFERRNSAYLNGNLLHLKSSVISDLKQYKDLRIHINLDLKLEDNIVGIDSYGLDGLDYFDITITGNTQDFIFLSNTLTNIKVTSIKHTSNINLILYDNVNIVQEVI